MAQESVAGGPVLEDDLDLSLCDLSRACHCSTQWLATLVHEGVLEPSGSAPDAWRFGVGALRRARVATHLMQDLEVNAQGAALALDLLEEIRALRHQLRFGVAAP